MAEHSNSHGGGHSHHITPISQLTKTFVALMVLMVLTILAAVLPYQVPALSFLQSDAPGIRIITNGIALAIAFIKAGLVVQIFMGVKFSSKVIKFYAYGGFLWFTLVFIILIDYFSRPWEPVQGWEQAPSTALPRDLNRSDGLDPNFKVYRAEKKDKEKGEH